MKVHCQARVVVNFNDIIDIEPSASVTSTVASVVERVRGRILAQAVKELDVQDINMRFEP